MPLHNMTSNGAPPLPPAAAPPPAGAAAASASAAQPPRPGVRPPMHPMRASPPLPLNIPPPPPTPTLPATTKAPAANVAIPNSLPNLSDEDENNNNQDPVDDGHDDLAQEKIRRRQRQRERLKSRARIQKQKQRAVLQTDDDSDAEVVFTVNDGLPRRRMARPGAEEDASIRGEETTAPGTGAVTTTPTSDEHSGDNMPDIKEHQRITLIDDETPLPAGAARPAQGEPQHSSQKKSSNTKDDLYLAPSRGRKQIERQQMEHQANVAAAVVRAATREAAAKKNKQANNSKASGRWGYGCLSKKRRRKKRTWRRRHMRRQLRKKVKSLFDSEQYETYAQIWNLVRIIAVLFYSFILPYRFCFLEVTVLHASLVVGYIFDIFFIVDFLVKVWAALAPAWLSFIPPSTSAVSSVAAEAVTSDQMHSMNDGDLSPSERTTRRVSVVQHHRHHRRKRKTGFEDFTPEVSPDESKRLRTIQSGIILEDTPALSPQIFNSSTALQKEQHRRVSGKGLAKRAHSTSCFFSTRLGLKHISPFLVKLSVIVVHSELNQRNLQSVRDKKYVKSGHFWLELFATFPIDCLGYVRTGGDVFRFIYAVRLTRVLRLWYLHDYVASTVKWVSPRSNAVKMQIMKLLIFLLMTAHLGACFWYAIGHALLEAGQLNWLEALRDSSSAGLQSVGSGGSGDLWELGPASHLRLYLFSLLWALATLTNVGYGDITPVHEWEVIYACVVMAVGFVTYARLVGSLVPILKNLSAAHLAFQKDTDQLKSFVLSKKSRSEDPVEKEMNEALVMGVWRRIQQYRKYIWLHQQGIDENVVLYNALPKVFRVEVCGHLCVAAMNQVSFLSMPISPAPPGLLRALMGRLKGHIFADQDIILTEGQMDRQLYLLTRGFVEKFRDVIEKNAAGTPIAVTKILARYTCVRVVTAASIKGDRDNASRASFSRSGFSVSHRASRLRHSDPDKSSGPSDDDENDASSSSDSVDLLEESSSDDSSASRGESSDRRNKKSQKKEEKPRQMRKLAASHRRVRRRGSVVPSRRGSRFFKKEAKRRASMAKEMASSASDGGGDGYGPAMIGLGGAHLRSVFGDDVFLSDTDPVRDSYRSQGFCNMFSLSRMDFDLCVTAFEEFNATLVNVCDYRGSQPLDEDDVSEQNCEARKGKEVTIISQELRSRHFRGQSREGVHASALSTGGRRYSSLRNNSDGESGASNGSTPLKVVPSVAAAKTKSATNLIPGQVHSNASDKQSRTPLGVPILPPPAHLMSTERLASVPVISTPKLPSTPIPLSVLSQLPTVQPLSLKAAESLIPEEKTVTGILLTPVTSIEIPKKESPRLGQLRRMDNENSQPAAPPPPPPQLPPSAAPPHRAPATAVVPGLNMAAASMFITRSNRPAQRDALVLKLKQPVGDVDRCRRKAGIADADAAVIVNSSQQLEKAKSNDISGGLGGSKHRLKLMRTPDASFRLGNDARSFSYSWKNCYGRACCDDDGCCGLYGAFVVISRSLVAEHSFSLGRTIWDFIGFLCILYYMIVLPFRIAFWYTDAERYGDTTAEVVVWLSFDWLVDGFFYFDSFVRYVVPWMHFSASEEASRSILDTLDSSPDGVGGATGTQIGKLSRAASRAILHEKEAKVLVHANPTGRRFSMLMPAALSSFRKATKQHAAEYDVDLKRSIRQKLRAKRESQEKEARRKASGLPSRRRSCKANAVRMETNFDDGRWSRFVRILTSPLSRIKWLLQLLIVAPLRWFFSRSAHGMCEVLASLPLELLVFFINPSLDRPWRVIYFLRLNRLFRGSFWRIDLHLNSVSRTIDSMLGRQSRFDDVSESVLTATATAPQTGDHRDATSDVASGPKKTSDSSSSSAKMIVLVLLVLHISACIWFELAFEVLQVNPNRDVWAARDCDLIAGDAGMFTKYLRSLYFVIVTAATIGYGDIYPTSAPECAFACFFVFTATSMYLVSLALLTVIAENASQRSNEWEQKMSVVRSQMAFRQIPSKLQSRIVQYYQYVWSTQQGVTDREILREIPDHLKVTLLSSLVRRTMHRVPIFQGLDSGCLDSIMLILQLRVFSPQDVIIREGERSHEAYFIYSGDIVSEKGSAVLEAFTPGQAFNENCLIELDYCKVNYVSVLFSSVAVLARADFDFVLEQYPRVKLSIARKRDMVSQKKRWLSEAKSGVQVGSAAVPDFGSMAGAFASKKSKLIDYSKVESAAKKRKDDIRIAINETASALTWLPTDNFRIYWNMLCGIGLLYYVMVVPFRVAFSSTSELSESIWVDFVIDAVFWADIYFRLRHFAVMMGGVLQKRRSVFSKLYMRTGMVADLIGTCPLDFLVLLLSERSAGVTALYFLRFLRLLHLYRVKEYMSSFETFLVDDAVSKGDNTDGETSNGLTAMAQRAKRGLGLRRYSTGTRSQGNSHVEQLSVRSRGSVSMEGEGFLVPKPRQTKHVDRPFFRCQVKPGVFHMLKYALVVVVTVHWIMCGFFYISRIEAQHNYDLSTRSAISFLQENSENCTHTPWILRRGPRGDWSRLMESTYFVVVSLSTVGYGDISPGTSSETAFVVVFVVLIGVIVYATVTANIASLASHLDRNAKRYQQEMDIMNDFMQRRAIDPVLRNRIRDYYNNLWNRHKGVDENEAIDDLPYPLKQDICVYMHGVVFLFPLFDTEDINPVFIRSLTTMLKIRIYAKDDLLVRLGDVCHNMFILKRGKAMREQRQKPKAIKKKTNKLAMVKEGATTARFGVNNLLATTGTSVLGMAEDLPLALRDENEFVPVNIIAEQSLFGEDNLAYSHPKQQVFNVRALTVCDCCLLFYDDLQFAYRMYPDCKEEFMERLNQVTRESRRLRRSHALIKKCLRKRIMLLRSRKVKKKAEVKKAKPWTWGIYSQYRLYWAMLICMVSVCQLVLVPLRIAFMTRSGHDRGSEFLAVIAVGYVCDALFLFDVYLRARRMVPQSLLGEKTSSGAIRTADPGQIWNMYASWGNVRHILLDCLTAFPVDVILHASGSDDVLAIACFRYNRMFMGIHFRRMVKYLNDTFGASGSGNNGVADSNGEKNESAGKQGTPSLRVRSNFSMKRKARNSIQRQMQNERERKADAAAAEESHSLVNRIRSKVTRARSKVTEVAGRRVFMLFFFILLLVHNFACIWFFIGDRLESTSWLDVTGIRTMGAAQQYLMSLYWAIQTMAAVGYGDITAATDLEMFFTLLVIISGSVLYAMIVGSISGSIRASYEEVTQYERRVAYVKHYMVSRRLPKHLQQRVQWYFVHANSTTSKTELNDWPIIARLPPQFRDAVSYELYGYLVEELAFLCENDRAFLSRLASFLRPEVYLGGEMIVVEGDIGDDLYFLHKGQVEVAVPESFAVRKAIESAVGTKNPEDLDPIAAAAAAAAAFAVKKEMTVDGDDGDGMVKDSDVDDAGTSPAQDSKVVLFPGAYFGEVAFFGLSPPPRSRFTRSASVIARTYVEVMVLTRDEWCVLMKSYPRVQVSADRVVCHRLNEMKTYADLGPVPQPPMDRSQSYLDSADAESRDRLAMLLDKWLVDSTSHRNDTKMDAVNAPESMFTK